MKQFLIFLSEASERGDKLEIQSQLQFIQQEKEEFQKGDRSSKVLKFFNK